MSKDEFKPGEKVRDITGRIGVVVPDSLQLCGEGYVLVEFDGSSDTVATRCIQLEIIGVITPEVNVSCSGCIFWDGANCLRYKGGRVGMLFNERNEKIVPTRIYPFCKEGL